MNDAAATRAVPVWDRFVRFFHWSLAACVLGNFFVVDDGETLHQWLGYTASALVGARIVWGFVGTRHARFSDFFPTPARIREHVTGLLAGNMEHHDGHNPLGAVVMLAMLAIVLALGATGFLQTTDTFWGEEWLQELHEALAATLIGCAGLHAAAAVVMSHVERTNLIAAMVTGVKVHRGRQRELSPEAQAKKTPAFAGVVRKTPSPRNRPKACRECWLADPGIPPRESLGDTRASRRGTVPPPGKCDCLQARASRRFLLKARCPGNGDPDANEAQSIP